MNNFKKLLASIFFLTFTSTVAFAYVTPGDINRLRGLVLNLTSVTLGTNGSIVAKATGSTTDINPVFSTVALGNPQTKTTYGTLTVASVNAGTGTILAGVTGRKIYITNFDIIATGSAATCTGVLLEDDNGTPVVITTLAAATLTSGSHNVPLTATLGVGFGAGSGLTSGAGVQLKVNGSACTTTTAFNYAVSYMEQ